MKPQALRPFLAAPRCLNLLHLVTAPLANRNHFNFLQWNCRGLRRKRDPLQQLLLAQHIICDALLLQGTATRKTIPGYTAIFSDTHDKPRVTTYLKKNIPHVVHAIKSSVAHTLVEVMPKETEIDHLYSWPISICCRDNPSPRSRSLLKTLRKQRKKPLINSRRYQLRSRGVGLPPHPQPGCHSLERGPSAALRRLQ